MNVPKALGPQFLGITGQVSRVIASGIIGGFFGGGVAAVSSLGLDDACHSFAEYADAFTIGALFGTATGLVWSTAAAAPVYLGAPIIAGDAFALMSTGPIVLGGGILQNSVYSYLH